MPAEAMRSAPAFWRSWTTRSRVLTSSPRLSAVARPRIPNEVPPEQASIQPAILSKRGAWIARTAAAGPALSADKTSTRRARQSRAAPSVSTEVYRRFRTDGTFSGHGMCAGGRWSRWSRRSPDCETIRPARVESTPRRTHGRRSASFAVAATIFGARERSYNTALHRELQRCL